MNWFKAAKEWWWRFIGVTPVNPPPPPKPTPPPPEPEIEWPLPDAPEEFGNFTTAKPRTSQQDLEQATKVGRMIHGITDPLKEKESVEIILTYKDGTKQTLLSTECVSVGVYPLEYYGDETIHVDVRRKVKPPVYVDDPDAQAP